MFSSAIKVRALGMKVYVDCGLEVGHIAVEPVGSRESDLFRRYPPKDYKQREMSRAVHDELNRNHAALLGAMSGSDTK
jgi:hypothetical protein